MDEVLASVASSADSGRKHQSLSPFKSGAPGETRTPDLLVRSSTADLPPATTALYFVRITTLGGAELSAVSADFLGLGRQIGRQENPTVIP